MIRYGLTCAAGHGFDGWFRSSDDFDAQSGRGLLSCPACGSPDVRKALMAPALGAGTKGRGETATAGAAEASREVALVSEQDSRLRAMLSELKKQVAANSEDVGERFPEVARKMHAQKVEHRSIRGKASAEEARALTEEGIEIHPLPNFPDDVN